MRNDWLHLVINSLHIGDGELEACSHSTKTDVLKFYKKVKKNCVFHFVFGCVNFKNKSLTINNSLFVFLKRTLLAFVYSFFSLWFCCLFVTCAENTRNRKCFRNCLEFAFLHFASLDQCVDCVSNSLTEQSQN